MICSELMPRFVKAYANCNNHKRNISMSYKTYRGLNVSLLVPCYNEELTIAKVVQDFVRAMPEINV